MASLSVSGIVRITRDAEERKTAAGNWYTFGIAAFRKNAKDGKQSSDFFDAELYLKGDQLAMAKNLRKGKLMFIENAFIRNDQFTGQDGLAKTKFKILVMSFEILNEGVVMTEPSTPEKGTKIEPPKKVIPKVEEDMFGDDEVIPF